MNPLKLTMTAFGSFAGTETVDFEKLGEKGIYLLTGDTGAGKTTIFDAIVFALYGSGGEAKNRGSSTINLHSDFAPKNAETSVAFSFTSGSKKYTVKRTF
jgi:exonuclease SbcC